MKDLTSTAPAQKLKTSSREQPDLPDPPRRPGLLACYPALNISDFTT
jgi:hypothetical protein